MINLKNLVAVAAALLVLTLTLVAGSIIDVDYARTLAKHSTPFRILNRGNAIYGSGSHISWKGKTY